MIFPRIHGVAKHPMVVWSPWIDAAKRYKTGSKNWFGRPVDASRAPVTVEVERGGDAHEWVWRPWLQDQVVS